MPIPLDLSTEERVTIAHALKVLAVDAQRGLSTFATIEEIKALRVKVMSSDYGRCTHPDLLCSMDAPHPRRDPVAYEQWLNREKRCPSCGTMVPERDL